MIHNNGSSWKVGDKVLVKSHNIEMTTKTKDGYDRFNPLIVGEVVATLKLAPEAIVCVGPYRTGYYDNTIAPCSYDYPVGTRLHPKTHKIIEM